MWADACAPTSHLHSPTTLAAEPASLEVPTCRQVRMPPRRNTPVLTWQRGARPLPPSRRDCCSAAGARPKADTLSPSPLVFLGRFRQQLPQSHLLNAAPQTTRWVVTAPCTPPRFRPRAPVFHACSLVLWQHVGAGGASTLPLTCRCRVDVGECVAHGGPWPAVRLVEAKAQHAAQTKRAGQGPRMQQRAFVAGPA